MTGWSVTFSGIPLWAFALLAVFVCVFLWRLRASLLRILAALVLLLFLLEPSITHKGISIEKPKVALIVDDSGSMHANGHFSNAQLIARKIESSVDADFSRRKESSSATAILLSDGRPLPELVESLKGVKVNTVLLGNEETPVDAVISDFTGPTRTGVSNKVTLNVRYRLSVTQTNDWKLKLRDQTKELATKPAIASREWREETFDFNPQVEGEHHLTVELAGEGSELTKLNNSAEITITAANDSLNVLLLDAVPRWDSRYIVSLLERNPESKITRRYASVHKENFFPTNLHEFDAIFLGDIPIIPMGFKNLLEEYVNSRGGFLTAIGKVPLEVLLPVRFSSATDYKRGGFGVRSEDQREITGIFSPELWNKVAPVHSLVSPVELKPGATTVLSAQKQTTDSYAEPLVVVQRFGAGRMAWIATQETWRWRDRIAGEVHDTFWLQLVSWGVKSKFRGKDERLQIALEDKELRVRSASDEVTAILGTNRVLGLKKTGDLFTANVPSPGVGRWMLSVSNALGLVETTEIVVPRAPNPEFFDLSSDPEFMERMAVSSGGKMFTQQTFPELLAELTALKPTIREQIKTSSLWDNYFGLALFTFLLAADWISRKRRGLD